MPYTNAVGMTYDSGQYETNMDLAMHIADWDGFEVAGATQPIAAGCSVAVLRTMSVLHRRAEGANRDTVLDDDRIEVVIGTQPSGQGHETSFAQVVSDLLGVPVASINIITGDTDIVSAGGGSHSGRSLRHAATVMSKAAEELIVRAKLTPDFWTQTRARSSYRRAVPEPQHQSVLSLLELAAELARSTLPDDLKRSLRLPLTMRCTSLYSPMDARCANAKSIPRPAGSSSPTMPRAMWAMHQPNDRSRTNPWRRRPGRRRGIVGAMPSRPKLGQPFVDRSWTTECRGPTPFPASHGNCRSPIPDQPLRY